MNEVFFPITSVICGVFTIVYIRSAKRGIKGFQPSEFLILPLSWFALVGEFESSMSGKSSEQVYALAVFSCALSPTCGLLWWKRQGIIRKIILRLFLFPILCLLLFSTLVSLKIENSTIFKISTSVILSMIILFPYPSIKRYLSVKKNQRKEEMDQIKRFVATEEENQKRTEFIDTVVKKLSE